MCFIFEYSNVIFACADLVVVVPRHWENHLKSRVKLRHVWWYDSALEVPAFSAYLPGANAKADVNATQQKLTPHEEMDG